jgi:hypothetical protein
MIQAAKIIGTGLATTGLNRAKCRNLSGTSPLKNTDRGLIAQKDYKREKQEVVYLNSGREGTRKSRSSMTREEKLEQAERQCEAIEDELYEEGYNSDDIVLLANTAVADALNNVSQDPLAGTLAQSQDDDSDESGSDYPDSGGDSDHPDSGGDSDHPDSGGDSD